MKEARPCLKVCCHISRGNNEEHFIELKADQHRGRSYSGNSSYFDSSSVKIDDFKLICVKTIVEC